MVRSRKKGENERCDELADTGFIMHVRKILKTQIMVLGSSPFRGSEKERHQVLSLLRRTIELAESNSALLIGPRGSGKSALVESVLSELQASCKTFGDCVVVRLNGYVHTDDRFAIKGIASQMQLENSAGDKVFGSFAENLTFLLQCLREGSRQSSKTVLFILEEFDLFCSHRNQTLLYNLFDVAQSAQAPICVLGMTSRKDVTDLLEKRVMSRFSNRQIYLYPSAEVSDEDGLESRINLLQELLSLPVNNSISKKQAISWNKEVALLCKSPSVRNCIKSIYETSTCERNFRNFLCVLVSTLNANHMELSPTDFTDTLKFMRKNPRVMMLEGLSVLELCLVIAMMHQTEIYDGQPFNFEMVLSRYLKFAYQNSHMLNVDRQVVLKAFEHLKSLELIRPLSQTSSQVLKEFQMFHFIILTDEVREAVRNYPGLPTEVSQWAISDYA